MSFAKPLSKRDLNKLYVKEFEKDQDRRSPPYHAKDLPNHCITGNDEDSKWISIADEEKGFKWVEIEQKNTIEEYLSQFPNEKKNLDYKYKIDQEILDKVEKELLKNKIDLVYVPWNMIYPCIEWWCSDKVWGDVVGVINKKYGIAEMYTTPNPYLYCTVYDLHKAKLTGTLTFCIKSNLELKIRKQIKEIFSQYYQNVKINRLYLTITL